MLGQQSTLWNPVEVRDDRPYVQCWTTKFGTITHDAKVDNSLWNDWATGAIMCKAPLKLSTATYQHLTVYRPNALCCTTNRTKEQETQLSPTNCTKVTKHGTTRHVMYGFLLVCYSNFVPKTRRFSDIRLQKCWDLDIWIRGHSRSLKLVYSIDYVWFPITVL